MGVRVFGVFFTRCDNLFGLLDRRDGVRKERSSERIVGGEYYGLAYEFARSVQCGFRAVLFAVSQSDNAFSRRYRSDALRIRKIKRKRRRDSCGAGGRYAFVRLLFRFFSARFDRR